jgi:hypothetical protein
MADQNILAAMSIAVGEEQRIQTAAVAISMALGPQAVDDALAECAGLSESAAFADQVKGRLNGLASMVLNRFPQPNDLLSAPAHGVENE